MTEKKDYKGKLQGIYKRQNDHIREHYDRVSVTLPKGTKEKITATGQSINGFINQAIIEKLNGCTSKDQE